MVSESLRLLSSVFDMSSISYDSTEDTYHTLRHRYKPQVLLPLVGISNNVAFLFNRCGNRYITTADNVKCVATSVEELHICECEDIIQKLYQCDPWSYLKKWHSAIPNMQSMEFILITLKKLENG